MSALCSIAEEPSSLPHATFVERYQRRDVPVVIRNATAGSAAASAFRRSTTLEELAGTLGDTEVTLSSANAFSYGRRRMRLAQYISEMRGTRWDAADAADADATDEQAAAGIYYFFGEHGDELKALLARYELPRYAAPPPPPAVACGAPSATAAPSHREPALSFGVAADGSGVPFHFHNDGFSEVMHGAKRWLLYPAKPPRFRENATSTSWLRRDYPRLRPSELPRECVIWPGDVLYFPKGWWHSTVNVGDCVFMSTFL